MTWMLAFSLPCAASLQAAESAQCEVVRLADVGWTDITMTTAVTRLLLGDLGYRSQVSRLSLPETYAALADGKIDVFLGNWMPAQEVIDEFHPPEAKDIEQLNVEKFFCQIIKGSCVYFVPGPLNIGITVGILGQFVATLNVPANTEQFPFSDQNDLGHAVVIEHGLLQRISYRDLAKRAYGYLST